MDIETKEVIVHLRARVEKNIALALSDLENSISACRARVALNDGGPAEDLSEVIVALGAACSCAMARLASAMKVLNDMLFEIESDILETKE